MYDVDPVALLTREVLRERTPALVAETCAWSVGLSDAPHHVRRHGRVVPTGLTLGMRAAAAQQLSVDEDLRLELGEPVAGQLRRRPRRADAPTAACRPTASTRRC